MTHGYFEGAEQTSTDKKLNGSESFICERVTEAYSYSFTDFSQCKDSE